MRPSVAAKAYNVSSMAKWTSMPTHRSMMTLRTMPVILSTHISPAADRLNITTLDSTCANGNTMNITCNTNIYSGTWNIVQGTLLGSGTNSLGTNSITVGANGVLETTYDMNSPAASLTLNGKMLLHQNDTFNNVFIGGTAVFAGTYSFAYLSSNYPAYFPTTWPLQSGSSISKWLRQYYSIDRTSAASPVLSTTRRVKSGIKLVQWWIGNSLAVNQPIRSMVAGVGCHFALDKHTIAIGPTDVFQVTSTVKCRQIFITKPASNFWQ